MLRLRAIPQVTNCHLVFQTIACAEKRNQCLIICNRGIVHRSPLQRVLCFHLVFFCYAFALQFGHGLGLAIHERPIISRLVSMDSPTEIKEGMVFALETYCPAKDGYSAARIEEELIVTDKGCQVISLFPAEELPIANKY